LVIGFLIIVIALIAFRILERVLRQDKVQTTPTQSGVPVAVTEVKRQQIEETLILTGDIRGLNEARVYPRVPGRLQRKIKEVGDVVKKGEVLSLVDRDEPALQFAAAEVTSPLDGMLTRYFIDLGEAVTPATPICEVADISSVKVVVMVPEKDLPRVKIGQLARFSLDSYPGETFTGKITRISEALNLGSRSAEVEIYSENPRQKLKPGMFAKVEIVLAIHQNAVTVPREAVAELGGTFYAFVIKNRIAQRRDLQIGIIKPEKLEILSGLAPAETLVTLGWHNLTEGSQVDIVEFNGQPVSEPKKEQAQP
jgi:multidrug efflux pump subunit AcrA (membrane-fusion protein)